MGQTDSVVIYGRSSGVQVYSLSFLRLSPCISLVALCELEDSTLKTLSFTLLLYGPIAMGRTESGKIGV